MAIDRTQQVKAPHTNSHIQNFGFDDEFQLPMTEILGYDGQNMQRKLADVLEYKFDYVSGTNPIYIGVSAPGTATSATFWLIKKLTFDGNDNVTDIQLANGSANFDQVWDNRASLSYS